MLNATGSEMGEHGSWHQVGLGFNPSFGAYQTLEFLSVAEPQISLLLNGENYTFLGCTDQVLYKPSYLEEAMGLERRQNSGLDLEGWMGCFL